MTDVIQDLDTYIRSRITLVVIVSVEELRVEEVVRALGERTKRNVTSWDVAEGFRALSPGGTTLPKTADPFAALEQVEKLEGDHIVVLKDFHELWKNPKVKRMLRNVAQRLVYTRTTLIVTVPSMDIPDELRDEVVIVEFPSPSSEDIERELERLSANPKARVDLTALGREKLVQAALGLTASQARRVFSKALVSDGRLDDRDIGLVTAEKKQIIRASEALEYYSVTETPDDVGGLEVLKQWLRLRERAFSKEAATYGLPAPRGIALLGIPGTGKSLTAKMIGSMWRMPLLRLDVGSLFGSLVGESEERARRALRLAETVAPCVVWIDEMEKALAQGGLDGGTSTRVFGTILTWMQEKRAPCFVVATANDISALPPELLRKGRFDEVFFLDLPTELERKEILDVHIRKRRRIPEGFDTASLAEMCEGYVGAELEQAVIDAMYVGFAENREFTTDDIAGALRRLVPLAVSQREVVQYLRAWLKEGRAQSASFAAPLASEQVHVPLEIPPTAAN